MLGDGRVVRRHVDQIHARQKLLVNLSEEVMDCKYPDLDFSGNSAPVVAKETDEPETEDILSETNPLELTEDSAQPDLHICIEATERAVQSRNFNDFQYRSRLEEHANLLEALEQGGLESKGIGLERGSVLWTQQEL
ncbi:hypothetical protein DPX16_20028 [Anabarilius grahami]|uniref:Uncharacterized protein n=1 Tax=Anabarilius grahami TaxID=495550 RepID=A0A3N0Z4T3_ANAGA|nr:hypothetical protein DPX16_20028 [Anabarilius grahami]